MINLPAQGAYKEPVSDPVTVEQNLTLAAGNRQQNYTVDPFWPLAEADPSKWDKYAPYQLIVLEAKTDNSGITQYAPYLDWQFTLPLPPESFSISNPFAMVLSPTLGGVVEESNGMPIRMITIRGTTGYLPLRASGASRSDSGALDQLESIFGGTVNTARSAVNSINSAAQALTGSSPKAYNVYQSAVFNNYSPPANGSDANANLVETSGFIQMSLLSNFLESYAAIKKTQLGTNLRLGVAVWKEDKVYLVTPQGFDVVKSADSPLEYKYALNFKAWKRVIIGAGGEVPLAPIPIRHDPNAIAAAINTLSAARNAVQKIGALKQAVLGDVDYVFKPLHDTILLAKDIQGAQLSVRDIPAAIMQRVQLNIADLRYQNITLWTQIKSGQLNDSSKRFIESFSSNTGASQDVSLSYKSSITSSRHNEYRAATVSPNKSIKLSDIPPDLADQLSVQALNLPQDALDGIGQDLARVRSLTRADFENYMGQLKSIADKVAFMLGAGDPLFADTYNISIVSDHTTTESDWATMNALYDSVAILQQFAATADGGPDDTPTILEKFGDLATASGIAWNQPVSKFAIPVPYGFSLEQISSLYLKDPNRWMEIAALNGLRAPYIDEVGYTLTLLANGKGNKTIVNDNADLFVGKFVWIYSNTIPKVKLTIESLDSNGTTVVVGLNQDVSIFKVTDQATLQGYLTGTINSQNQLWIPSNRNPIDEEDVITKDVPGIDNTDPMVGVGGVDLLQDNQGNLVIEGGDIRLVSGMANIVQWVRTLLGLHQGDLQQHPGLGLSVNVGMSLADFSAEQLVKEIKRMLQQDGTFSNINSIKVAQNGPVASINIGTTVAGTSQPLPLSYGMQLA